MKKIVLLFTATFLLMVSHAQQIIPLYGDHIPNSKPVKDEEQSDPGKQPGGRQMLSLVSRPTLTVFLPAKDKANGTAVVICPGGGYVHLAIDHEGYEVARHLNDMGIVAVVLKYRLPSDSTMIDKTIGPLQDAQQAIKMVRENASAWAVNPDRVGIMGFSAGGHLASTAGTHFTKAVIENKAGTSLRPDFMILGYPVISFADSLVHRGSRDNHLGRHPTQAQIREYSNELQVTPQTPPTFLVQAFDDKTVKAENSLYFYEALLRNGVPSEMHLYPHGGHGFGLHNRTTNDQWIDRLQNWMDSNGWLKK
jgi:acetyl esterase/lipase